MKAIKPGYRYELGNFEDKEAPGQVLQFIEKAPVAEGATELMTVKDGTTNEEVVEVLIDRLNHMQAKLPSRETALAITKLEEGLMWMNRRTAARKARGVEGTMAK